MPDRFLFRGIRLVDPAADHDAVVDVVIEDESVAQVGADLAAGSASVIDGVTRILNI